MTTPRELTGVTSTSRDVLRVHAPDLGPDAPSPRPPRWGRCGLSQPNSELRTTKLKARGDPSPYLRGGAEERARERVCWPPGALPGQEAWQLPELTLQTALRERTHRAGRRDSWRAPGRTQAALVPVGEARAGRPDPQRSAPHPFPSGGPGTLPGRDSYAFLRRCPPLSLPKKKRLPPRGKVGQQRDAEMLRARPGRRAKGEGLG